MEFSVRVVKDAQALRGSDVVVAVGSLYGRAALVAGKSVLFGPVGDLSVWLQADRAQL